MAKRKDAASLFEVISQGKDARKSLHLPGWAEPHQQPPTLPAGPPDDTNSAVAEAPKAARASVMPPQAAPALAVVPSMPRPELATEPVVLAVPGRLRLNLSYMHCALVALGLLVLLAIAYWLGTKAGKAAVPAEGPGVPGLKEDADRASVDPQKIQKEAIAARRQGAWYLVIQYNVDSLADAMDIQKYLYTWGYTPIILGSAPPYVVMDTKAYAGPEDERALDAVKNLEELGQSPRWALRAKYPFKHPEQRPLLEKFEQ